MTAKTCCTRCPPKCHIIAPDCKVIARQTFKERTAKLKKSCNAEAKRKSVARKARCLHPPRVSSLSSSQSGSPQGTIQEAMLQALVVQPVNPKLLCTMQEHFHLATTSSLLSVMSILQGATQLLKLFDSHTGCGLLMVVHANHISDWV
jgi:hypothetical protein